ncbi:MAG TPA: hypothetical protein QGF58_22295 [Myxococcota bacterium]|nr:hypothetical protein [Myxococcota bacterium]
MTIPDQLRALAAFLDEHGLTDEDVLSAGISYEGGRVLLRIAPFRVLAAGLCVTMNEGREGHTHHEAETASGGMAITLAACTRSDMAEAAPTLRVRGDRPMITPATPTLYVSWRNTTGNEGGAAAVLDGINMDKGHGRTHTLRVAVGSGPGELFRDDAGDYHSIRGSQARTVCGVPVPPRDFTLDQAWADAPHGRPCGNCARRTRRFAEVPR